MQENTPENADDAYKYAGFWLRVLATLIDSVILFVVTLPLLLPVYGWSYFSAEADRQGVFDFMVNWIFPLVTIICFWIYRQATPGKMLMSAKIVNAKTGENPSIKQCIIRYLGYFVSLFPLGLGIFWVGWDKKKQGWHDKLAGTVVVISNKTKHSSSH